MVFVDTIKTQTSPNSFCVLLLGGGKLKFFFFAPAQTGTTVSGKNPLQQFPFTHAQDTIVLEILFKGKSLFTGHDSIIGDLWNSAANCLCAVRLGLSGVLPRSSF
jgi:hypothetical protein